MKLLQPELKSITSAKLMRDRICPLCQSVIKKGEVGYTGTKGIHLARWFCSARCVEWSHRDRES